MSNADQNCRAGRRRTDDGRLGDFHGKRESASDPTVSILAGIQRGRSLVNSTHKSPPMTPDRSIVRIVFIMMAPQITRRRADELAAKDRAVVLHLRRHGQTVLGALDHAKGETWCRSTPTYKTIRRTSPAHRR